jgi:hypothetical protein
LFSTVAYGAASEPPEKLIPARRDDLIAALAFALTRDSRPARMQAAKLLASIVAERIVDRLEASGYVVMRGPPAPGAAPLGRGMRAEHDIVRPSGSDGCADEGCLAATNGKS